MDHCFLASGRSSAKGELQYWKLTALIKLAQARNGSNAGVKVVDSLEKIVLQRIVMSREPRSTLPEGLMDSLQALVPSVSYIELS